MTPSATNIATSANRHAVVTLALAGCLLTPFTVRADHAPRAQSQTASRAINIADLDLSTPAGMATAGERVTRAAQLLCHRLSDSRRVDGQQMYTECVAQARDQAWQRLLAEVLGSHRVATSRTTGQ